MLKRFICSTWAQVALICVLSITICIQVYDLLRKLGDFSSYSFLVSSGLT